MMPALVTVLSGCATAATGGLDGELFERYEAVAGPAKSLTVVPGFFLAGTTAELALVRVEDDGDRRLLMYGFDGDAWAPVLDAPLRQAVSFVDVANIGGHDRLITHDSGRLSWFDPDSATERFLVEIGAGYRVTDKGRVPRVDITRDLNRDGRDDFIVPDVDGFWIATQEADGSFGDAVKLGPPEPFADRPVGNLDVDEPAGGAPRTWGEVGVTAATLPVYLGRVHQMDYDRDGLSDLAFWSGDRFDVHLQGAGGRFSAEAVTFAPGVPFDSDGAYSRAFEYTHQGMGALLFGFGEKTERTVLHSLRDLDGDRVADLVTLKLAGPSLTRQRAVYQVHFGTPTADGTAFAGEIGTAIQPRGKAWGMQPWGYASQRFEDLDGDGHLDLVFHSVNVGLGGMMRALVGNSVPIRLELYRGKDGVFPDRPTTRRRFRRFAPFAGLGNVFFPPVLLGDVNGDGRSDLVVGHGPRELRVFLGVPGEELLARRPHKVAVTLPRDERDAWLVDLNRDGKQDVLMHRGPTDRAPNEPHRLTMLIAR